MKKLLAIICLALPSVSYSQNIEVALSGGFVVNTAPTDNMYYKADKYVVNYAGQIAILYNFAPHLQAGLEGHVFSLSNTSSKTYVSPFTGSIIGNDNKKFVYASLATSVCAVGNAKLNIGYGYAYAGLALGYSLTRDDSKTLSADEAYKAPDGGKGFVLGAQVGYVHGISASFGFFIEAAMRYCDLKYDAQAPFVHPAADLHYQVMVLPVTIGLRYRFVNSRTHNNIPRQKGSGKAYQY